MKKKCKVILTISLYTESSETQYHQGYDFESYGNSILQAVSELTGAVFTTTSCGIIRWCGEPFFGLPRMNLPSAAWKQSEDSVLRLGLQFKGKSMEFPLPILPNHIPLILREMNCNSLNECWMRLTIDNSLTVDISPDDLDYTGELEGILRQFTKNDIEKYIKVLDKGTIKQLKIQGPTYNQTPPLETMGGVFAYMGKLRWTRYGQGRIVLSMALPRTLLDILF